MTAITLNASNLMVTPTATPSVTLGTPNAYIVIVTPIMTLVTQNASPPNVILVVAPIVTPLVTLVTQMADIVASRAILCSCIVGYVC